MPKHHVTIPEGYQAEINCPSCLTDITRDLHDRYVDQPCGAGGEHPCRHCGEVIYSGVFRPEPVFTVDYRPDGTTSLAAERIRRGLA